MIEKVNIYHKDKVCDYVANAAQYYYTNKDENSITSLDVTYYSGSYEIVGQVSSSVSESSDVNLRLFVASKLDILYNTQESDNFQISNIKTNIGSFSSSSLYYYHNNLANDNSVAIGYAKQNAYTTLPFDVYMANQISRMTNMDGNVSKTIVTLTNGITMSFDITLSSGSNSENSIRNFISVYESGTNIETGSITFNYDSFNDEEDGFTNGVSGMKLSSDLYGSVTSVPSGPISGRDMRQIDKISTIYARKLAEEKLEELNAGEVFINMVFKKGEEQPIMVVCSVNGNDTILDGDFSIQSMRNYLGWNNIDFCHSMIHANTEVFI